MLSFALALMPRRSLAPSQGLFATPYDEHAELSDKYYQRAPEGAAATGGIGFMS